MLENDPRYPFFIWARSPNRGEDAYVRLACNKPWLDTRDADEFSSALAQYAGHIHGYVMVRERREFTSKKVSNGLLVAHALFKGVKRDLNDHDLDRRHHVYVMNPVRDYAYEDASVSQRGHLMKPKPLDSVFVAYVEFEESVLEKARSWYGDTLPADVAGVINRWEWVMPLDPSNESLPVNYDTRYDERVW